MTQKLAALTGGTGFLGGYVGAALEAAGWKVRRLVRPPRAVAVDCVRGDLDDAAALDALVADADVVVHLAGLVKASADCAFFRVNRDGCRNLAAAIARAARPPRIVAVSSLAARHPELSAYAASKRAGEDAFRDAGLRPVVLRPTAIYGPGDREAATFLRACESGTAVVPAAPGARVTVIHAADVAAAVVAACEDPACDGETWELTDPHREGYGWRELFERIAAADGARMRILPLPRAAATAFAALNAAAQRVLGRAPMLTPGKVRELFHPDWSSAPERQPPERLWRPRIDLADGIVETLRHLRTPASKLG
jgi:nucleoside-diphosphate-sugar epimerase